MDLSTGRLQLYNARKIMLQKWEETREVWHDGVSQAFEDEFVLPVNQQAQTTVAATDRLSTVLARMRQDCE